ncbi:MAG: hypothetical protein ACRD6W_10185, partial [Nitrososphaerales archaeon]
MTTPQKLLIVVEDQTDANILRVILGDELKSKTRFFSGHGKMGLPTIGRNLLVHEGGPVLVVMDSDTLSTEQSEEEEALASYALASIASGAIFGVFTFKPEIDAVFFETPRVLERLLGKPILPETVREGLLIPKQTVEKLLHEAGPRRDYLSFVSKIDPETGAELAKGEQAAALIE